MDNQKATVILDGKTYEFPIIVGSEGEQAIDIRTLRAETGFITLDNGFANTGCCESKITFIDGEEGILRYYGIPIEQLCEQSKFPEVCWLLLNGRLPTADELATFSDQLTEFSMIHEDVRHLLNFFPADAHPMNILSSMVNALASFYPHVDGRSSDEDINMASFRLISQVRTLAAFSYKKSIGEPVIYPRTDMRYCRNFLNMMFSSPVHEYETDDLQVKALNMLFIMHAEHEQNCSTSAVRLVGSSQSNLFAAISSGISALWGPLHGGANQKVMEMLNRIYLSGGGTQKFIDMAKDKNNDFRLSGFGHRVYKNYDPRARIIKDMCMDILSKTTGTDPLLEIALQLEEQVLKDEYFVSRKLYPNVDFYSGLIYQAMGFPTDMFTVLFAIGRLPGWMAQWKEMVREPSGKIFRPRQIYIGSGKVDYVPIDKR